jgi:hypothetical protein
MRFTPSTFFVLWIAQFVIGAAQAAEPLPFEIQNARGANGLVFVVSAGPKSSWSRVVRLTVAGDVPRDTKNLRIVTPISVETEGGVAAEIAATLPQETQLVPGQWSTVEFTGRFTEPGVYRGELLLVQGTQQRVVPIQVTVQGTPPMLPIQEHGGRAISAPASLYGEDLPVSVSIRLRNTGGELLDLEPLLAGVARIDKPDNPSYQFSVSAAMAVGEKRRLASGAVEPFDLLIRNIDQPGVYSVETLFRETSGKYQPLSVKSTVYRRQSAIIAAVFICLGAVLAWLVRWFVSDGNKRLALRRRIALLGEAVRGFSRSTHTQDLLVAAQVLEADVRDRQRDAIWGGKFEDIEKIIARAEARLALLHEIAAATDQLKKIESDKQPQVRKVLDEALLAVRIDFGDDAKVATQREAVANLLLTGVRREQLRSQRADLAREIDRQRRQSSHEFASALGTIEVALTQADGLLGAERLDELETLLATSRSEVLTASIDECRRLAERAAPVHVTNAIWARTTQQMVQHLERARKDLPWDQRYAALQEAQKTYYQAAVRGLIQMADESVADGGRKARLTVIADELRRLLEQDIWQAAQIYAARLAEVTPPASTIRSGVISARDSSGPVSAPQQDFSWLSRLLPTGHSLALQPRLADTNQLTRAISSIGWLVNFSVLVIAVGSGVKALWLDNLSWGGPGAWLAAFLWGAGVQAIGDLFTGLVGLRAKLGAPPGAT